MTPKDGVEDQIGAIVARYQEIFGIEIFGYCFLSNHYHLIIRSPKSNTDEFCENINREIARRINRRNRRIGAFWHRRYDDQEILSQADLLNAFLYVTTNPTHHALVSHPAEWPGLNSYSQSLSGEVRTFSFCRNSAKPIERRISQHRLVLSLLPQFERLTPKLRRKAIEEHINRRLEWLHAEHRKTGTKFLGRERILAQDPNSTPKDVSCSPRPVGYSLSPELRRRAREDARLRRERYCRASTRYRLGDTEAKFPAWSFRPPLHRKPRTAPFTPLSRSFLQQAA
jgi:REP element-mobilizing transposase RayT